MFFFDDRKHHLPHIHANFGEYDAVTEEMSVVTVLFSVTPAMTLL